MRNIGWKFGRWLDTPLMQLPLGPGATTPPQNRTKPGHGGSPAITCTDRANSPPATDVSIERSTRSSSWPRRTIRPVAEITLIGALAARQFRIFFDAVERHFRCAAEHRKHRTVFQEIDGVIAPFAGGDLAAVKIENAVEFAAAEGDLVHGGGAALRAGDPPPWDWLGSISPEPNVMRRLLLLMPMIAPGGAHGKGLIAGSKCREKRAKRRQCRSRTR